jgi:elongation factor Ts
VASRKGRARSGQARSKLGVLIEINCESDFVARTDDFQKLVKELAMQVAATNPRVVRREELAPELVEQERKIYAAQAEGKPAAVVGKIVDGKIEKFFKDVCLLEQAWVRDPNITISELVTQAAAKMGEKVDVRRFVRFQLGEQSNNSASAASE